MEKVFFASFLGTNVLLQADGKSKKCVGTGMGDKELGTGNKEPMSTLWQC